MMGFITKEEKPNCVAEMTKGFVGCAPRPARLACSISGSRLGAVGVGGLRSMYLDWGAGIPRFNPWVQ